MESEEWEKALEESLRISGYSRNGIADQFYERMFRSAFKAGQESRSLYRHNVELVESIGILKSENRDLKEKLELKGWTVDYEVTLEKLRNEKAYESSECLRLSEENFLLKEQNAALGNDVRLERKWRADDRDSFFGMLAKANSECSDLPVVEVDEGDLNYSIMSKALGSLKKFKQIKLVLKSGGGQNEKV